MDAADKDADLERLSEVVGKLGEHYDSVQVFVTRHESGEHDGTVNVSKGCGNWFARYGQVKQWVTQEEQAARNSVDSSESEAED